MRFFVVAALFLVGSEAFAESRSVPIDKTIETCVKKVRAIPSYGDQFFHNFDAFYNPSDGTVQNNATSSMDMAAVFQFNKCMTELGYPLSKNNK
jgi:hypothetical protein